MRLISFEYSKKIVMTISEEVAPYFKRRKLIANQVIKKELEYGGLIISAKVGHANLLTPASAAFWSAIKTAEARAKKKVTEDS